MLEPHGGGEEELAWANYPASYTTTWTGLENMPSEQARHRRTNVI